MTGILAILWSACSVGGGKGWAEGCLFMPGCGAWQEAGETGECAAAGANYRLEADFFAADALGDGSLEVRVQRGGYWVTESDGLLLVIPAHAELSRAIERDGFADVTVPPWDALDTLPPSRRFRASYYLNASCGGNDASLSAGTGALRLTSLYRQDSESSRIAGEFDLLFEDTRPAEEGRPAARLRLRGSFDFEYQRGLPAQHFP